jgi:hypothetical protein
MNEPIGETNTAVTSPSTSLASLTSSNYVSPNQGVDDQSFSDADDSFLEGVASVMNGPVGETSTAVLDPSYFRPKLMALPSACVNLFKGTAEAGALCEKDLVMTSSMYVSLNQWTASFQSEPCDDASQGVGPPQPKAPDEATNVPIIVKLDASSLVERSTHEEEFAPLWVGGIKGVLRKIAYDLFLEISRPEFDFSRPEEVRYFLDMLQQLASLSRALSNKIQSALVDMVAYIPDLRNRFKAASCLLSEAQLNPIDYYNLIEIRGPERFREIVPSKWSDQKKIAVEIAELTAAILAVPKPAQLQKLFVVAEKLSDWPSKVYAFAGLAQALEFFPLNDRNKFFDLTINIGKKAIKKKEVSETVVNLFNTMMKKTSSLTDAQVKTLVSVVLELDKNGGKKLVYSLVSAAVRSCYSVDSSVVRDKRLLSELMGTMADDTLLGRTLQIKQLEVDACGELITEILEISDQEEKVPMLWLLSSLCEFLPFTDEARLLDAILSISNTSARVEVLGQLVAAGLLNMEETGQFKLVRVVMGSESLHDRVKLAGLCISAMSGGNANRQHTKSLFGIQTPF